MARSTFCGWGLQSGDRASHQRCRTELCDCPCHTPEGIPKAKPKVETTRVKTLVARAVKPKKKVERKRKVSAPPTTKQRITDLAPPKIDFFKKKRFTIRHGTEVKTVFASSREAVELAYPEAVWIEE